MSMLAGGAMQSQPVNENAATLTTALEKRCEEIMQLLGTLSSTADLLGGPRPQPVGENKPEPISSNYLQRLRRLDSNLTIVIAKCDGEIARIREALGL